MKFTQIRTLENVYMGVDLTKNIVAGGAKDARFPGLSIESYEGVGVKISLHNKFAIVPWSNITVALGSEAVEPLKVKNGTTGS